MSALPQEMITNVLSRLPVKSLLRFRCVSKPWCTEIDSPYFINLHLNLSTSTKSNLSIISVKQPNSWRLIPFSINTDSEAKKIKTPFIHFKDRIRVWGSSNGLLLLRVSKYRGSFFLFNPSTKKHFILPDSPKKIKDSDDEHCFLVYDAMNDDYKVFSILLLTPQEYYQPDTWITSEARVYSLKSNLWRTIKDFENSVMDYKKSGFAYINGALHSINETRDPVNFTNIVGREIIAVDIESGDRHIMTLPESIGKYDICYMTDKLVDGCLCVLKESLNLDEYTSSVDIWVMKEYGTVESWSMLHSVVSPELCNCREYLIFYSESCNEVLLLHKDDGYDKLLWHDLQTGTKRNFLSRGFPFSPHQEIYVCVESLVPLPILWKN